MPRPVTLMLVAVLAALLLGVFVYLLRRLRVTEDLAAQLRAEIRAREIIESEDEEDDPDRPKLVLIQGLKGAVVAPVVWAWDHARAHSVAASSGAVVAATGVIMWAVGPATTLEEPGKLIVTEPQTAKSQDTTYDYNPKPDYLDIHIENIDRPEDESVEPEVPPGDIPSRMESEDVGSADQESGSPHQTITGETPPPGSSAQPQTGSQQPSEPRREPTERSPVEDPSPPPTEAPREPPPPTDTTRDCLVELEVSNRAIDVDVCVERPAR